MTFSNKHDISSSSVDKENMMIGSTPVLGFEILRSLANGNTIWLLLHEKYKTKVSWLLRGVFDVMTEAR